MKTWQRISVIAGSATLVLAAGAGIAAASIPDSGGVIHGCYKPQSDGYTLTSSGGATERFGQDQSADHSQALAFPRPVNNGHSWDIQFDASGAGASNGLVGEAVPITVTFYVICE